MIEKKGRYSKDEIEFIKAEGRKSGVMPPVNKKCSNCWRDMAIEIMYVRRQAKKSAEPKGERKYRLMRGDAARYGVVHKGRLITNDMINEELYAWMMANDFPEQLLER